MRYHCSSGADGIEPKTTKTNRYPVSVHVDRQQGLSGQLGASFISRIDPIVLVFTLFKAPSSQGCSHQDAALLEGYKIVGIVAQKRSPKRMPSFLKAKLHSENLTQSVCVRDVSVNGALLDVTEPLKVFEIVTLMCGDTKVNGIVAWSDEGRLGIEFSELLTCEILVDSLKSQIKVSAPKSYQPEI